MQPCPFTLPTPPPLPFYYPTFVPRLLSTVNISVFFLEHLDPLYYSLSLLSISLSPPFTIVYIYYFSFSQSIFGRYSIQPFNPSISLFVYLIFYFKLFYYITFYLPSREKKIILRVITHLKPGPFIIHTALIDFYTYIYTYYRHENKIKQQTKHTRSLSRSFSF